MEEYRHSPLLYSVYQEYMQWGKILGVTSVVVTHDIRSMFKIADRVAFLYEGRMAFVGTPDEARNADHPVLRGFIEGRGPDESEL